MRETDALALSTGFVNYPNVRGYLPFAAVNPLLATGRWTIKQATCWGYVMERSTRPVGVAP
jgi:hypothetical protein